MRLRVALNAAPALAGDLAGRRHPGLGFYGLRSTAWAGNLRLQSEAGSWSIVISHWGRIRLCRSDSAGGCQ